MTRAKLAVIDEYGILDPDAKISEASLPSWLTEAGFQARLDQQAAEVLLSTEQVDTAERYAAGETVTSVHIKSALDASVTSKYIVRLRPTTYVGNLTIPDNTTLVGAGIGKTIIQGRIIIGSNVTVQDLTVEMTTASSWFGNNSNGSILNRVQFKGATGGANNFYLNDSKATNHIFNECIFSDCATGNGVQIVDKGTAVKHYENIIFNKCIFRNNGRMNFECIQRSDAGNPVVLGYRNISIYGSRFETPTNASGIDINVSYDSGTLTADATIRSSGYSTFRDNILVGGGYGLELAGPRNMTVTGNHVSGTNSYMLSTSQIGSADSYSVFANNTFIGTNVENHVVFAGAHNLIEGNMVRTPGLFRLASCNNSRIVGNYVDCTGTTAVSLDPAWDCHFTGNSFLKGTNQTVLVIYTQSINNSFTSNYLHVVNVGFDLRNSLTISRHSNVVKRTTGVPWIQDDLEIITALPTPHSNYHGKTYILSSAGVADTIYACVKRADGTYAWSAFGDVLVSPNNTRYRLTVGDDGALTTTAL